jgi:hypothetical protein
MEGLKELTVVVDRLSIQLRMIVFFLMTVGFILKIRRADFSAETMLPIIASSLIILGLIASQDWWFKQTQDVFFTIATQIKSDYEENPYKSMQSLQAAKDAKEKEEGFGHLIKNIKASVLDAVLSAFMWVLISTAAGFQVIFACVYYILIEMLRLLFPLALACYAFDGLRSMGAHFVSKALSIMAWPVGFALIERIARSLQEHFYESNSVFDQLHGGIYFPVLISILVIGGTLTTPVLMSSLFTSGDMGSFASNLAGTVMNIADKGQNKAFQTAGRYLTGSGGTLAKAGDAGKQLTDATSGAFKSNLHDSSARPTQMAASQPPQSKVPPKNDLLENYTQRADAIAQNQSHPFNRSSSSNV